MKIVARTPRSRAAAATAWPWLPALAATTPAARSSADIVASLLTAPRILNEPVRWRFSAFRTTGRPTRALRLSEPYTGVTRACAPIRSRAAWMSESVGVVLVAKVEYLPKDRTHGGERVELSALDRVEEAAQLGIGGDDVLEMPPGAGRRDREYLRGEMLRPALLQQPRRLEMGAMRRDFLPEGFDPLAAERLGENHGRLPGRMRAELQHLPHLVPHRLRERVVALVDDDHVRDLHDPGLQRLDRVARARHQDEHDRVRDRDDADLALAGADRLEQDEILAGGVEQ